MDWIWLLFGFKGRINRGKLWLAMLVILGLMIVIAWIAYLTLLLVAGGYLSARPMSFHVGLDDIFAIFNSASYHHLSGANLVLLILQAVGTSVLLWIYFAACIKRLYDCDKSGWWMVPFFVLPGLYGQFSDRLGDSIPSMVMAAICAILLLWGFVEMYCLGGDRWTNRFGANPLPKTQGRPRAAHTSSRGTAWDQHDEIEFVPHKGSPPPL